MEMLFKKYFWVVVIVGLILSSYMVGSATSLWVGDKVFGSTAEASTTLDVGELDPASLFGNKGNAPNAESIIAKGVFDSDKFSMTSDFEGGEDDFHPEEELQVGEVIPESKLGIKLVGTMVTDDPALCMASIEADTAGTLVGIGSSLADDKATVVRIEPKHMLVKEDGEIKVVKLWTGEEKKPEPMKAPVGLAKKSSGSPKPSGSKTDYKQYIKSTGQNQYTIDKQMLEEELKDLTKIGMQARIVPNYKGGKYEGFKLIGVKPGSLYRAIGIRSGDVIKRINGEELNSPNKAISLFEQLKNSPSIALDMERGGNPVTMSYKIE